MSRLDIFQNKTTLFGLSIVILIIIFAIVKVVIDNDTRVVRPPAEPTVASTQTESGRVQGSTAPETEVKSPFDEQTIQYDMFFANALKGLRVDKMTTDEAKITNAKTNREYTQIVRKAYLKYYTPLETANLTLNNIARLHDIHLIDAIEYRDDKEHYVRLWFGHGDNHTNSVYLYPGRKSDPAARSIQVNPVASRLPGKKVKLGIIIDDFGVRLEHTAMGFINLPYPITVSILPYDEKYYPDSKKIAKEAYNRDKEVMLHLPMEPTTYPDDDPGPGAVFVNDGPEMQREIIRHHLNNLSPYVKGVNNHMGSKATGDWATMGTLMTILGEQQLYFVDSKTNRQSVAVQAAYDYKRKGHQIRGVRENWFFLDPYGADESFIKCKLQEAADIAREKGSLVVIGHMNPKMLSALEEMMPKLVKQDIEFVPVSHILH